MMNELLVILGKGVWAGLAGLGFGILFNIPRRSIFAVFLLSFLGGIVKFGLIKLGWADVVVATLMAALTVGIINVYTAHRVHTPPVVMVIPAVIPMVPGAFAYKAIIGFSQLALGVSDPQSVDMTIAFSVKTLLTLLFIAIGVSSPLLLLRKESIKNVHLFRRSSKK